MRLLAAAGIVICCLTVVPDAFAGGVKLKAVRFPGNIDGEGGTKDAPTAAPLSQRIVFEFDGKPKLGPGVAEGLRIRVADSNSAGQPIGQLAFGKYQVKGNKVIFTPRLPTAPMSTAFSTTSDVAGNVALPGLLPDTVYRVSVSLKAPNSVKNLKGLKKNAGVPLTFKTTAIMAEYFGNSSPEPVKCLKGKLQPSAGATGIHPNAFNDPAGLFSGIGEKKRPPFKVVFDAPVDTTTENFSRENLRLRAILTPAGAPEDLDLGATAVLTKNRVGKAEVLVYPSGILPLGHTIVLELSNKFMALSGAQEDPIGPHAFNEVAQYRVALDPLPGSAADDYLFENFDTTTRQDASIAAAGQQLASWDAANSNVLRASFGFGGDGSLGRFDPPPGESVTILLDTDYQAFPLFSGATPEAEPGTVVEGGVFNFTSFTLPENSTLIAHGSNPLIITATQDVLILGLIDLSGENGTGDDTFDSAITAMPGGSPGPGGGKGGDSHPVKAPGNSEAFKYMQTPQYGQSGYGPGNAGPGGGGGGQCGCTLPWTSFTSSCNSYSGAGDGSRGSGGGGGSFNVFFPDAPEATNQYVSGRRGAIGIGNHLPVVFKPGDPIPNEPNCYNAQPGNPTNALATPNPNPTFTQAYQQGLVYDNGTTMGYTGSWAQQHKVTMFGNAGPAVFKDADPNNNFIGTGGELEAIIGGQGGGGAGSRSEGLDRQCYQSIFVINGLPLTVLDARGGGGGGGAGSMMVQALGKIEIKGSKAKISARGGKGAGGEGTQSSSRGGSGGGGSGGAVILQSAANVHLNDSALAATVIDVSGGCGDDANTISSAHVSGGEANTLQCFDGGPGGPGLVQIHIPVGAPNQIDSAKINAQVHKTVYNTQCTTSAYTNLNPLVPMGLTPTPLTPKSRARSTWYDLGAVTSDFRPPIVTAVGTLGGPLFGVPGVAPFFRGTSPQTGQVMTDASGNVVNASTNDFQVDAPDPVVLLPDFIPQGPEFFQEVQVLFEGADEDAANPGSPNLATSTGFVSDVTQLNGKRFVRWEIRFDIATNSSFPPQPNTPRPQVNWLRLPFKY